MNSMNALTSPAYDSWASAFVDGEATLSEQESWSEKVHEQLYYYTVTRQVLRGESPTHARSAGFEIQQRTWVHFWARVDSA